MVTSTRMIVECGHRQTLLPDLQKLPVTAREISINDLAQNVSNATNHKAASVDSTRQSVKVGGPSVKLHDLSQSVTDRLMFVDRLVDRVCTGK